MHSSLNPHFTRWFIFWLRWEFLWHSLERLCVRNRGLMLLITTIMFVPSKIAPKKRLVHEILHVAAHLTAALILVSLLELGIEICIQHKFLATSGQFPFHIMLFGFPHYEFIIDTNGFWYFWDVSRFISIYTRYFIFLLVCFWNILKSFL